jgi:hypothetical protein
MLSWILGILGVGGLGVLGAGLALKFGLLAFLPGAVVNVIGYIIEGIFRAASWFMETFFTGNINIFKTWQASFALVCWILFAMIVGPAPITAALNWRPWHYTEPAADNPADMPRISGGLKTPLSGLKAWGKKTFTAPAQPTRDDASILRHQLGGS